MSRMSLQPGRLGRHSRLHYPGPGAPTRVAQPLRCTSMLSREAVCRQRSRFLTVGNKVLHNIVGGHLGMFEGNGQLDAAERAIYARRDAEWKHSG